MSGTCGSDHRYTVTAEGGRRLYDGADLDAAAMTASAPGAHIEAWHRTFLAYVYCENESAAAEGRLSF